MSTNLVEYMSVFTCGQQWAVVETGMPEHAVRVGTGDSLREAYESLQGTQYQSVGRDCGLRNGMRVAAEEIGCSIGELEEDDSELEEDDQS